MIERTKANRWGQQLKMLQSALAIAYAISLPLSMTVSWSLLIAGIICWILEALANKGSYKPALLWPITLLAIAVGISGLFNGGISEALRSIWSLKAITVYFWISHLLMGDRDLALNCLAPLLLIGGIAGIWGSIQQLFNLHPFGYQYLQGTGFLSGPMAFAGQMQILALLSVACFISACYRHFPLKLTNKWIFLTVTIANLSGLVFAGERSAWLGGTIGLLAIAALFSIRTFAKFCAALLIIGAISWATVPLVHTRVEAMFSGTQDVSTRVRLQVWNQALTSWQQSPIVGIGFLKFPHLDIPEAIVPGHSKDINHAHSNYLQLLTTTGIIGLATYLLLCGCILFKGYAQFRNGRLLKDRIMIAFGSGIFGATIALMISGLFEYNFGTAQVRLMQWFILGFLSVGGCKMNNPCSGINIDIIASKERLPE